MKAFCCEPAVGVKLPGNHFYVLKWPCRINFCVNNACEQEMENFYEKNSIVNLQIQFFLYLQPFGFLNFRLIKFLYLQTFKIKFSNLWSLELLRVQLKKIFLFFLLFFKSKFFNFYFQGSSIFITIRVCSRKHSIQIIYEM